MQSLSPILRNFARTPRSMQIPSHISDTTLLDMPMEMLSLLLNYLPLPDLVNFTSTCTALRSLRTSNHRTSIANHSRSRRLNQENLRFAPEMSLNRTLSGSSTDSSPETPRRVSTGALRDLNSSSSSDSPSPRFGTPVPNTLLHRRRNSVCLGTPRRATIEELPVSKTPLSTLEKKSKRRLRRL